MNTLITIPHFSTLIPQEFKHEFNLEPEHMNLHLDYGTEKIFDLPNFKVLKATASRFLVDLNRPRDDLSEGQGVIITETWDGEPVLKHKLTPEMIETRLTKHYDPFYQKLDEHLTNIEKSLLVLDGHSMDSKGSLVSGDSGEERPEIDLATGKGTCSDEIVEIFEQEFQKHGFQTLRNKPYSGERGHLIHYCVETPGVQALELEVNKKVYMNEKTFEFKNENVNLLRLTISSILKEIGGL